MASVYNGNNPYIFISYSHKDSHIVLPIIEGLQNLGYRVWFDRGIEIGSEWSATISRRLKNCEVFFAFTSHNSIESPNCLDEIAHARKYNRKGTLIFLQEDVCLPDGMEMQTGRFQNAFYCRHPNLESFLDQIQHTSMLNACRDNSVTATEKSKAPVPEKPKASAPAPQPQQPKPEAKPVAPVTPPVQKTSQEPPVQKATQTPPAQKATQTPPVQKTTQAPPVQKATQTPPAQKAPQTPPAQQAAPATPPKSTATKPETKPAQPQPKVIRETSGEKAKRLKLGVMLNWICGLFALSYAAIGPITVRWVFTNVEGIVMRVLLCAAPFALMALINLFIHSLAATKLSDEQLTDLAMYPFFAGAAGGILAIIIGSFCLPLQINGFLKFLVSLGMQVLPILLMGAICLSGAALNSSQLDLLGENTSSNSKRSPYRHRIKTAIIFTSILLELVYCCVGPHILAGIQGSILVQFLLATLPHVVVAVINGIVYCSVAGKLTYLETFDIEEVHIAVFVAASIISVLVSMFGIPVTGGNLPVWLAGLLVNIAPTGLALLIYILSHHIADEIRWKVGKSV